MKGLAAIVVFLSHTLLFHHNEIIESIAKTPFHLFFDGQCAVMVFFVLSGYFYCKDKPLTIPVYLTGIRRKLIRLWPLYILAVTLAYLFYSLHLNYNRNLYGEWVIGLWDYDLTFIDYLKQICFKLPVSKQQLVPPGWYMGVEARMIFAMPLIVALCNKTDRRLMIIFAALSVMGRFSNYAYFCFGTLVRYVQDTYPSTSITRHSRVLLLILGVLLIDIRNMGIDLPKDTIYGIIQAIGSAILIYCIVGCTKQCSNRLLLYLGERSYVLYLMHFTVLLVLRHFNLDQPTFILFAVMITLLITEIVYRLNKYITNKIGI